MKTIKYTVCIFSLIWLASCHVVHYPAKKTWTGRFDTVRFEKNCNPLCKDIVMYKGDTIKRYTHFGVEGFFDCNFNFNCNDTVTIHAMNIEKKRRPYIFFVNDKIYTIPDALYGTWFRRQKTGIYLENKLTGELLHGLCKIIYDDKRYSIAYYYYGRPYLPTLEFWDIIEYYYNDKYLYHSFFDTHSVYDCSLPPLERVIKSKGNKIIEIVYHWETGQKLRKSIYKKYGDKLLLIKWIPYRNRSGHRKLE